MKLSAYRVGDNSIAIQDPASCSGCSVDYVLSYRDGVPCAELNQGDLQTLYNAMPHGASPRERSEYESYLTSVAEGTDD